jgi:hypothetical protein
MRVITVVIGLRFRRVRRATLITVMRSSINPVAATAALAAVGQRQVAPASTSRA